MFDNWIHEPAFLTGMVAGDATETNLIGMVGGHAIPEVNRLMCAERFGVADAAVERGIKAIGNVIDTSADYPGTILASAIWHMEATIDQAVAAVKADNFTAKDYGVYSFMQHGGSSVVVDETLVPEAVRQAVAAKQIDILSGAFVVTVNDEEPVSDN